MVIEAKRRVDDVEVLERASWEQEIDAARRGVRADLSRKAAAYYLGVHHTNLSKLRTKGIGPASVQARAADGGGVKGRNTSVRYALADLDAWKEQHTASSYDEQLLKEQVGDLRAANVVAELKLQLRALEAEARSLRDKLSKHGLAFSAHDAFQLTEWVIDPEGYIQGHIPTVDEHALLDAIEADRIDELTPADALQRQWSDVDAQQVFADEISDALQRTVAQVAMHLEAGLTRHALHAALK